MLVTKRWWFSRWEIETPGARPPAKSMVAATKEKVDLNQFNVQSALILGCLEDFLGKVSWFQSSEPEVAPRLSNKSQLCCQTDLKEVRFTKRRKDSAALILTKAVFFKSWDTGTHAESKSNFGISVLQQNKSIFVTYCHFSKRKTFTSNTSMYCRAKK